MTEEKTNWYIIAFRIWGLSIFAFLFYEWIYKIRFPVMHFPMVVASITWIIMQIAILINKGDDE